MCISTVHCILNKSNTGHLKCMYHYICKSQEYSGYSSFFNCFEYPQDLIS